MPCECLVDEPDKVILIRLIDVVTGSDLVEAKQAQLRSTAFGPGVRIIWGETGIALEIEKDTRERRQGKAGTPQEASSGRREAPHGRFGEASMRQQLCGLVNVHDAVAVPGMRVCFGENGSRKNGGRPR